MNKPIQYESKPKHVRFEVDFSGMGSIYVDGNLVQNCVAFEIVARVGQPPTITLLLEQGFEGEADAIVIQEVDSDGQ